MPLNKEKQCLLLFCLSTIFNFMTLSLSFLCNKMPLQKAATTKSMSKLKKKRLRIPKFQTLQKSRFTYVFMLMTDKKQTTAYPRLPACAFPFFLTELLTNSQNLYGIIPHKERSANTRLQTFLWLPQLGSNQ